MRNPLETPNKIAFAGDWHGSERWSQHAVEYANNNRADVIVHAGDFGYDFTKKFVSGLNDSLRDADVPLLFVDGNHENFDYLYSLPINRKTGLRKIASHIYHIPRGKRWVWDGVQYLGLGGAHSVDKPMRVPYVSWWPEEKITPEQVKKSLKGGLVDVMITHDCPAGVEIPGLCPVEHFEMAERGEPVHYHCNNYHGFQSNMIREAETHREFLAAEVVTKVKPSTIFHGHYHRQYNTQADLGYGPVSVFGLSYDDTRLSENMMFVTTSEMANLSVLS